MKTKTTKFISALAMAATLVFSSTAAYAEEAVSTAAEPQSLETYCPTNDDEEFPFNMEINVMPGSIQYIDLEEPIYGYESVLDEEALIFDVNFSLKDEFKIFDGYEFQVFSSDYSEVIASEYLEMDEVFTLPGLSIGEGYKIGMTLESESLTASYGGQFVIQAEWNGSLSVDLFYQLANTEGEAAPYVDEYNETEPKNNTISGWDPLLHGRIMNGSTSSGDVDYFKSAAPIKYMDNDMDVEDRTGVVNLEYTLDLTPGAEICIEFFDENNKSIRKYETGKSVTHIFCRFANVEMGSVYYIKITSKSSTNVKYKLQSSYQFALAWYGQFVSKDGDGVYWNANKLNTLEIEAYDTWEYKEIKKPFFIDNNKADWMAKGCGIAASAMILRNLGATMNGYDFRTGYNGRLQADPFTVMMANCKINGADFKSSPTYYHIDQPTSSNEPSIPEPDNLEGNNVANKFDVSYSSFSNVTEEKLINALEKYGYLLIYFKKTEYRAPHFMVLTNLEKYNANDGKSFAQRATVFDPAALTWSVGAGIDGKGTLLENTKSVYSQLSVDDIQSAGYYY